MHKLTLRYQQTRCRRCGVDRQTRITCPDCGERAAPTEFDIHVQRRQRAVQLATAARASQVKPPALTALELLGSDRLLTLPKHLLAAATKIADGRIEGPAELAVVARDVAVLEAWATSSPELRPMVALARTVKVAVRDLTRVFDDVVEALIAESLAEAQSASNRYQASLDSAAVAVALAGDHLDRAARVLGADDLMGAWFAEALAGDPVAATTRGQTLYADEVGRSCGPGAALSALALDVMVSTLGDRARFWHLTREHTELLANANPKLVSVLAEESFQRRALDVTHDLWLAAQRAALMPLPETLRGVATDLLQDGHLVVEQALKFHLGMACACFTRRTFSDTQACDVSDLANVARDKGWAIAGALGTSELRNAFAHRDYEVLGDRVLLSPARHRREGAPATSASLNEVQNSILEFIEASAAMDLALIFVAEDLGVEGYVLPPAQFLVRTMLVALGWSDVELTVSERTLVLHATVAGEVPLGAVAYAAQPFVDAAEVVQLHLGRADTGMRAVVEIPLGAYKAWSNASDVLGKEVAFLQLSASTTRNGSPVMDSRHAAKYIAFRACQVVGNRGRPFAELNQDLRRWRAAARDLGLDELQRLIGRAQRWRAMAETDLAVDPAELEPLLALAGTVLDPIDGALV